jgi:hypothetical protein
MIEEVSIHSLSVGDIFLLQAGDSKRKKEFPSFDNLIWLLITDINVDENFVSMITIRQPPRNEYHSWLKVGESHTFSVETYERLTLYRITGIEF